ncbi:glucoamylase family protein [Pedobacter segetis]|nr:glucoamylase family protein [Pedobacter segetis]
MAKDASLSFTVNGSYNGTLIYKNLSNTPVIKISSSEPLNSSSLNQISLKTSDGATVVAINITLSTDSKSAELTPKSSLSSFTNYQLIIPANLETQSGGKIINPLTIDLQTGLDGIDKFPRISDDELLTLIQKQTFKYFWDFAHPNSGLARERNTSGDLVTTGGSGFGIMGIIVAINRNFITKAEGLARLQKIVAFLKTADKFHGAFPHWLDGNTGKVLPFSTQDDGADLVETSFLMEGLLTARQYFSTADPAETQLRADINQLYNNVEWDWFRKNGENTLYWHWSPKYNFDINLQLNGWNEALMVYVLGASSTTHTIPKSVYDIGWATNGGIKNGNTYYNVNLPLGPAGGGPLFYEHYSMMALNPNGLTDAYANYETQAKAHSMINYNYCVANPKNFVGYSADSWGLTASDVKGGYTASSPTNDNGYIAPTAAVSSIPYTPEESLKAIRFFYYKLGDKMWGDYGFKDAYSLTDPWFAQSYIAIDQGPQIVMIENYRTGLIWDLFMSCPEVKAGLTKLGFQSPKI